VNLGTDQVVQSLVKDASNENVSWVGFSSFTVDHGFTSSVSQSISNKTITQAGFLFSTECRTVDTASFHGSDFAANHFENVGDRHPRRDGVRVYDEVRDDTVFGEGHVFLLNQASNDTFLSVS
tara:strand:- start:153 stop:521 length:369 start_codon:yes stop_codon:yes gene_type:complete